MRCPVYRSDSEQLNIALVNLQFVSIILKTVNNRKGATK
jgi:hypothetical protein